MLRFLLLRSLGPIRENSFESFGIQLPLFPGRYGLLRLSYPFFRDSLALGVPGLFLRRERCLIPPVLVLALAHDLPVGL